MLKALRVFTEEQIPRKPIESNINRSSKGALLCVRHETRPLLEILSKRNFLLKPRLFYVRLRQSTPEDMTNFVLPHFEIRGAVQKSRVGNWSSRVLTQRAST